jgi:hypothetical protein
MYFDMGTSKKVPSLHQEHGGSGASLLTPPRALFRGEPLVARTRGVVYSPTFAHLSALLFEEVFGLARRDWLVRAASSSQPLLRLVAERGENVGSVSSRLLQILDGPGAADADSYRLQEARR